MCHMAVSHLFAAKINGPERVVLAPLFYSLLSGIFCLLHVCVLCRILFKSLPYCAAQPCTRFFCHVVLHRKLFS